MVHRRVLRGTDHDNGIRGVAYHQHQHAEQRGVEETLPQPVVAFLVLELEQYGQTAYDGKTQHYGEGTVAHEGNTEQGYAEHVEEGGALAVEGRCAPDSGQHDGYQDKDVDYHARVEGKLEVVHEEPLEPTAYLHDARHNAVEHGGHKEHGDGEGNERTLGRGVGLAAVVVDEGNGGQTEQVQQVNADGKAREVEDEHEPTVGVGLVGVFLPLQDEPEYQCREHRGIGIDFPLHGGVPEGVAPGIGQGSRKTAGHDEHGLLPRLHHAVVGNQHAGEVGDGPEEEEDTQGR